jgi:hypothetical protein
MDAKESDRSSVWKNRREWIGAIVGILALFISVGGYMLSRKSATSGQSLILVAQKSDNPDGNLGLSFVFHPLNANQKISRIDIVFPPAISTAAQSAEPLTQEINLGVASHLVEHYESSRQAPYAGTITVWDGSIPIVLEAQYIAGDESLTHRGLYKLRTRIVWRPSGPPLVKFLDVIFDHALAAGTNYAEALTYALAAEEEAQRKLFNPTQ